MPDRTADYKIYVDWTGHGGLYMGPAGWFKLTSGITFTDFAISDEQPYRGQRTLKGTSNALQNPGWGRSFRVRAGVETTLSVWVYNPSGGKENIYLNAFKATGDVSTSTTLKDQWVELSLTFNETVDVIVGIIVGPQGAVSAGTWYLGPGYVRTDFDDVTCDAFTTRTVLDTTIGRDKARDLSTIAASQLDLELNNYDGKYTPTNINSPLNRWVTTQHQILVTDTFNDEDRILFTGVTEQFSVDSSLNKQSITFNCMDMLAYLATVNVTTDLFPSIRTGDAFLEIMRQADLTSTLHYSFLLSTWELYNPLLDHGATILTWWSFNGDAKEAFDSIIQAEGAPSFYSIGLGGQIEFKDRHHRVRPDYPAPVYTLHDCTPISPTDSDIVLSEESTVDYGYETFSNRVVIETKTSAPGSSETDIWTDSLETRSITGELVISEDVQAFTEAVVPVGGQRVMTDNVDEAEESNISIDIQPEVYDFVLESGTVTASLTYTSGTKMELKLIAAGTAVISGLRVRGRLIQESTQEYTTQHEGSQTYFGRTVEAELNSGDASYEDAIAISEWYLKNNNSPRPTTRFVIQNRDDNATEMILDAKVSDRFIVDVDAWYETGVNYVAESVRNTVDELGKNHILTIEAQREEPLGITQKTFKFGTTGYGFGQGVFGQFATAGFVFGSGRFGVDVFGFNSRTDKPFIIGQSAIDGTDELWY